ncbi:Hypothetical predicted protein [Paramuricea clavata]|uniref:Uncharacterized protein n=1 Tax=Paramuricea clavata TaxID=317549 RepID=A0A7D9ILX7_PARCT|nr:Hypothetical predicted protein [Paramuricea clavata]
MLENGQERRAPTNFSTELNLTQIIKTPTRITATSQTLIDVILVSSTALVLESGVINTSISDHLPVYVLLKLKAPKMYINLKNQMLGELINNNNNNHNLYAFYAANPKTSTLKAIPREFGATDLCKHNKQWRHVQHLANVFWSKWRKEFLPTLQPRRKWQEEVPNLEAEDLVLLRCKDVAGNEWPHARVIKAYKSADGEVRKLNLITTRDGAKHIYTRPVTEVVLLRTVHELK